MVAVVQPNPRSSGVMVRLVDYPFLWLTKRNTPRGFLGDLFGELRNQWNKRGCPIDEQLDQQWLSICLDAVCALNSDEYNDELGLVIWEFEASTSSNDVGSFLHYDYGVPSDDR